MIHEMSIQTGRPGQLATMASLFATQTLALRRKLQPGRCLGAWTSEFGELNNLYSLWEFADAGQQQEASSVLSADAAWQAHAQVLGPMLAGATTMLLKPYRKMTRPGNDSKLYDFRQYDINPFHAETYARLLAEVLPVREKYSRNFGIWTPAVGSIHQVVHLWPYQDLDERNTARAGIAAEPAWKDFFAQVFPLLRAQRSSLLRPVPGLTLD